MFIGNFLLPLQPFVIPLNGLAQGRTEFCWSADGQFFSTFENSEILDAELSVEVLAEKSGRFIGLDLSIEGVATVECDRCLSELRLPVSVRKSFSIKFGEESAEGESAGDGEREILFIPEDNTDLDMGQVIYDYTCLSLPLTRVHEEGACDQETVKYLGIQEPEPGGNASEEDSPFAALKNLFDDNK